MGLFSAIAKGVSGIAKGAVSVGRTVSKTGLIPGLATAYTAYDIGKNVIGMGGEGGGGDPSLPALPGGLPALPGSGGGLPGMPGGAMMQAPQGVYYQPIVGENVSTVIRCMSGYVLVNYPAGTTSKVCMLKNYARSMGLWRPSKKPPISVRDWSALGRADKVIRKLRKVDSRAKRIANYRSPTTRRKAIPANYTVIDEGSGSANLKVIKAGRK